MKAMNKWRAACSLNNTSTPLPSRLRFLPTSSAQHSARCCNRLASPPLRYWPGCVTARMPSTRSANQFRWECHQNEGRHQGPIQTRPFGHILASLSQTAPVKIHKWQSNKAGHFAKRQKLPGRNHCRKWIFLKNSVSIVNRNWNSETKAAAADKNALDSATFGWIARTSQELPICLKVTCTTIVTMEGIPHQSTLWHTFGFWLQRRSFEGGHLHVAWLASDPSSFALWAFVAGSLSVRGNLNFLFTATNTCHRTPHSWVSKTEASVYQTVLRRSTSRILAHFQEKGQICRVPAVGSKFGVSKVDFSRLQHQIQPSQQTNPCFSWTYHSLFHTVRFN